MPKVKERVNGDKIKNQGKRKNGKPIQQRTRRVITAKLKKELAQQKRGSSSVTERPRDSSATTEAVDQVEQTAGAAVRDSGHQIKQGVSRAITKVKKERQKIKERQNQLKEPDTSAPEIPEQHTPATPETGAVSSEPLPSSVAPSSKPRQAPASPDSSPSPRTRPDDHSRSPTGPKVHPADTLSHPPAPKERMATILSTPKGCPADTSVKQIGPRIHSTAAKGQIAEAPAAPPIPSPGGRMLQQAMSQQQEQVRHPERSSTPPAGSGQPVSTHYNKQPLSVRSSTAPKDNLSLQNQSINPSIKERPRRSAVLKEKPHGGGFTPRTRPKAEQGLKNVAPPTNGKKAAANLITNKARQKAQREAQRNILQRTKQTAKTAAGLSRKAAIATAKVVKALIGALSALMGGVVLVAALCVIFLVAAVIVSPFGILFANEPSPGAVPLNVAVSQINMELTDKLTLLQAGTYDSIDIQGTGPDWREVTAVFACKTAMGTDGLNVAALTPDRVDRLKAVFWDMCTITSSPETINHPAVGSTAAWSEQVLHITITAKTADDMRTAYLFNSEQNSSLTELLAELGVIGDLLGDLSISQESVTELLSRLPADLSPERRAVVETACKLVGKVTYFWGGKSKVIGWDSRWGTLKKVWADGNSTTGTYRPFGLDCSGFADWVFYNISGGSYTLGHGGGVHAQHTYCTAITWAEAQPGDLVFYPGDTHVGIVGGWDEGGNIQIIHCTSSYNNVVITGKAGFATIGRPMYYTS